MHSLQKRPLTACHSLVERLISVFSGAQGLFLFPLSFQGLSPFLLPGASEEYALGTLYSVYIGGPKTEKPSFSAAGCKGIQGEFCHSTFWTYHCLCSVTEGLDLPLVVWTWSLKPPIMRRNGVHAPVQTHPSGAVVPIYSVQTYLGQSRPANGPCKGHI